jgi:hypothetical protein
LTIFDLKKHNFKYSQKYYNLLKDISGYTKEYYSLKKRIFNNEIKADDEDTYNRFNFLKKKIAEVIALDLTELNIFCKTTFNKSVNRNNFRSVSPKNNNLIYTVLDSSFSDFVEIYCKDFYKDSNDSELTRDHLEVSKVNKKYNSKFFVTSISPKFKIHEKFLNTILAYCKINEATLIVLPMNGVNSRETYESSELELIKDYICTEFKFNNNLKALDIKLSPQQINPLTGLDRFGEKEFSLIIASPKQQMKSLPIIEEDIPHILHTTGMLCENMISYHNNRIGRIAEQDHILGGLIVEVKDKDVFFIRQIRADDNTGEFTDLITTYSSEGVKKTKPKAIYFGDSHSGWEDNNAIKSAISQIKELEPEEIFLGDIFDGHSISHHHENNIKEQVNRLESINTLEKELHAVAKHLQIFSDRFPKLKINIIRSNHDEHLDRYLNEGRYVNDRFNHRIALDLAIHNLDGHNPIEKWLQINYPKILKNVTFLNRESIYKIGDIQCASHGDIAYNGIRASALSLEKAYTKCTVGHSHTPQILRNVYVVGTMSKLKLSYTKGVSSWTHTNCTIYENGDRQLLTTVKGHWKI